MTRLYQGISRISFVICTLFLNHALWQCCACLHTPPCIWVCECMCPAETVYVHSSPARPCCSLWCKLCMCKKHSIIRPSIIRGCQWALSGWYITLSCPLPQLGPTQPARHVGNTAGRMYSAGQELGFERCSIWCAFLIRMMPYCICSPIWMMMNVVRRPGCPLQLKKSEYWILLVVPTV